MDLTKDFQLFIKQHPHCTIYLFYCYSPKKRLSETIEKNIKKTLHNFKKHNLYINDKAPTKLEIITNSKSAHYKPCLIADLLYIVLTFKIHNGK